MIVLWPHAREIQKVSGHKLTTHTCVKYVLRCNPARRVDRGCDVPKKILKKLLIRASLRTLLLLCIFEQPWAYAIIYRSGLVELSRLSTTSQFKFTAKHHPKSEPVTFSLLPSYNFISPQLLLVVVLQVSRSFILCCCLCKLCGHILFY